MKNYLKKLFLTIKILVRKKLMQNQFNYSEGGSTASPSNLKPRLLNLAKLDFGNRSDLIDVKELIKQLSVEELCQTAEEYFARIPNWDYHLSKPFASIDDNPELLICFAQVIQGLQLLPEMTVLDFGAGSCWTSRYLTQLGCHVIALDVSSSALKMGRELYTCQPVLGDKPPPQFLHFDGLTIDLPDQSVDRIFCFDAFHHVPNAEHVIKEFSRILKQGGIAGFSEPGPNHSKFPQSQDEMRNFRVLENDIDIRKIWADAQKVGFTNVKLNIFNALPCRVSLNDFEEFIGSGRSIQQHYVETTRLSSSNRRIFFLYKGEATLLDSRQRAGLVARLDIKVAETKLEKGRPLLARVTVTNTSSLVWLPTTAKIGGVNLGAHLFDESGTLIDYDYFRQVLTPEENRAIFSNETFSFDMQVPLPTKGHYLLEFDLVSEGVCWFSINGSKTVKFETEII